MVEYIYDVIRVSAGEPAAITAKLLDEDGLAITENCNFRLFRDNLEVAAVSGIYENGVWFFTLPTSGLDGKYEYAIYEGEESLCFKKLLYVV